MIRFLQFSRSKELTWGGPVIVCFAALGSICEPVVCAVPPPPYNAEVKVNTGAPYIGGTIFFLHFEGLQVDELFVPVIPIGGPGEVHMFKRDMGGPDAWGHVRTFNAPTPDEFEFGGSQAEGLVIAGDTLIVGSPGFSGIAPQLGAVYVYERDLGGPEN